jgi:hypothetical protein
MRILIINQNWFAPELRLLGHEVITAGSGAHLDYQLTSGIRHIDALLAALPNGFKPDRIIWHDNSAPLMILGLEDCPIPSLMYSVDTHHHSYLHSHLADCFDHVCVAQRDYLNKFHDFSTPVSWLPLWASENIEPSSEKRFGAVFVGTLNSRLNPDRVAFFEELRNIADVTVMQGHFPSIFPHAEIVINQTVKGDLNFRVFESMISGALLLTERRANGLLDLFNDGEHLVTYTPRDTSDAADKIKELLSSVTRTRSIAARGREDVLSKHRPIHRALEVESILRPMNSRKRPDRRHFGALMNALNISTLLQSHNPAISAEMIRVALECGERGLTSGAVPNQSESTALAQTCLLHDAMLADHRGAALLLTHTDALSSDTAIKAH